MRALIAILFVLLYSGSAIAQNEAANWFFGDKAGIRFQSDTAVVLSNSAMHAETGCAVISNQFGKLQFYTNGKDVWNNTHQKMPNGFGLSGSQILNQNSLIVPLPGNSTVYYLFTINARYDSVGLSYSIINMNLDNGLGDIEIKNQFMYAGFIEKITAAKHCNGNDVWIVTHDRDDGYYSFLLTAGGLQADTVRSFTGNSVRSDIGYMKMSPASNRIVLPLNRNNQLVEVSLFHNRSGKVYNPIILFAKDENIYAYGLEFSADGNLLYVATGGRAYKIWQYDLTQNTEEEINASATLIAEGNHFAMQLAPDSKIYIAREYRNYLSTILHPEQKGLLCGFEENTIDLQGNTSLMGLPNFMPFLFYKPSVSIENPCLGDSTSFSFTQFFANDSLTWNFGDATPDLTTTSSANIAHPYGAIGTYPAVLYVHHCGITDTVKRSVQIFEKPEIFLGNDTSLCNLCTIVLDGGEGMDNWLWQDGSENRFYQVEQSGQYSVLVTKNECSSTDSIFISNSTLKLVVPTAFTPNGDGLNDDFRIYSNEALTGFHLLVFNRKGGLIFESRQIEHAWDGQYKGSNVPLGIFSWQITYSYDDEGRLINEIKRGTVMLLR